MTIRVGTAGWSIPRTSRDAFPADGATLARYAAILGAVEVNSSFYRHHAPATWQRWAASVPADFRFAVKFPKAASHERRLIDCAEIAARFLDETAALTAKRGPVLVQLPPNLAFDATTIGAFLAMLRRIYAGLLAFEPRHASWAEDAAIALLADHDVARVAADPSRFPGDDRPAGAPSLSYWRLHGSPAIYRTPYAERCETIAAALAASPGEAWCIFDNTMTGAATADALRVRELINP